MFNLQGRGVLSIEAKDLYKIILEKKDHILLDVRTPMEFSQNKIKGAINLPVDQVEKDVKKIIPKLETTVYVYCLSGSRSIFAVEVMTKLGYKNVFDLSHGLMAWRVNRLPLE